MTTINRKDFVNDLSSGAINVNDMSAETKEKLSKAGISQKDLVEIAGKDGQINGMEYQRLFTLLDKSDKNGSWNSFKTADDQGFQTKSGLAYEALKSEVDKNIAKARSQGVIHLGMRPASVLEADALAKANPTANGGVVRIDAHRTEGVLTYEGKQHDLKTEDGLKSFCSALTTGPDKLPKDQAQKFVDQLKTMKKESRDELAQLGLSFHRMGNGSMPVNRLVLSGHGDAVGTIGGDDRGAVRLADIERLARVFPNGASKMEHVAISACFCAGRANFEDLKRTFPNLKSVFAYNEFSPDAENGAPAHLKRWESMTDGDDPSQVDPKFGNTATWNVADGFQGLPKISLKAAEEAVKDLQPAHEKYLTGKTDPSKGTRDPHLDEYYVALSDLIRHPEISPERKKEIDDIRKQVLKLRHPELDFSE
jgi:hypothetical protein